MKNKKKTKSNVIFVLFILINIIFIFLQIHKQSYIVKLHYNKQKIDKEKENLIQQKNLLEQQLYELKSPSNIVKFATDKLNMQKIQLNQTNKIKIYE